MKHTLKAVGLSGVVALWTLLASCTTVAPPDEPATERDTSTALSGNQCDAFCQSQGGPHYLFTFATDETSCNNKGGQWYTADQGYPGPPPGCCCKCASPGFCL